MTRAVYNNHITRLETKKVYSLTMARLEKDCTGNEDGGKNQGWKGEAVSSNRHHQYHYHRHNPGYYTMN
uniref:Uncharacterized protein n=1 Tax=Tetranychus urticae TaxID=32264 RepID=T1KJB5_TETUR